MPRLYNGMRTGTVLRYHKVKGSAGASPSCHEPVEWRRTSVRNALLAQRGAHRDGAALP